MNLHPFFDLCTFYPYNLNSTLNPEWISVCQPRLHRSEAVTLRRFAAGIFSFTLHCLFSLQQIKFLHFLLSSCIVIHNCLMSHLIFTYLYSLMTECLGGETDHENRINSAGHGNRPWEIDQQRETPVSEYICNSRLFSRSEPLTEVWKRICYMPL